MVKIEFENKINALTNNIYNNNTFNKNNVESTTNNNGPKKVKVNFEHEYQKLVKYLLN